MEREAMREGLAAELYKIATADATAYVKVDGEGRVTATPTARLTKAQRAAVSYIKEGKGAAEVKPCDKLKAIELLGKHLGMWEGAPEPPEEVQAIREEVFGRGD